VLSGRGGRRPEGFSLGPEGACLGADLGDRLAPVGQGTERPGFRHGKKGEEDAYACRREIRQRSPFRPAETREEDCPVRPPRTPATLGAASPQPVGHARE